jgi:hypothetical protein
VGRHTDRRSGLGQLLCLGELSWRQDRCDDLGAALSSNNPVSSGCRLTGRVETIDIPGYNSDSVGTWVAGQATGSFSTEDGPVSKTALCCDQSQVRRPSCGKWAGLSGKVLLISSLASPVVALAPRAMLYPALRTLPSERTPLKRLTCMERESVANTVAANSILMAGEPVACHEE